ncbi:hypothetical protein CDL12_17846 [Handroanthus impetiginosus]|uniref:Ubiquitinyl hydrolase 1 n=1 Tax=Handroanthus impetiginosus TaxID=429701 RepID=A0A2G9GX39_9LAMI|nr:hypothetical protein CDL12_17846 [Handroanthus impetiginosus]
MRKCVGAGGYRKKYLDDCTVGLMVFEFNPISQELCLLNSDSIIAAIVRTKDHEIKELKKRVVELEVAANKNLCVLIPVKVDTAATKEQGKKEDGENKEVKEKEDEKEEERKDDDNDEERDHDAENEYNDMNEENQTKHHMDFDERDYEAVCTLSSIVDGVQNRDELIEK